jgi:hypothetical protein
MKKVHFFRLVRMGRDERYTGMLGLFAHAKSAIFWLLVFSRGVLIPVLLMHEMAPNW